MKNYIESAAHPCDDCGADNMEFICTRCLLEMCRDCAEDHDCDEET